MNNRRQFLQMMSSAMTSALLAPFVLAQTQLAQAKAGEAPTSKIPIAFSTLGCPTWEWHKILEFAQQHGFSAIELRGLEKNMDLPTHPVFAADRIQQTKKEIRDAKLKIANVSSSANLYFEDATRRAKELSDARRFIDLASTLEAPYVRVFGGKDSTDKSPAPDDATKARVASALKELGAYAGSRGVTVIIESHDHFTSSATLKDVMQQAGSDHVGLLWDAHHTFATSNEDPDFTVKQLGPWIRHTHLKDSTGSGEDRHYVLTGRGNVPVAKQIAALRAIGYKGYYCFEWEKVWHPEIDEPEIAIADYARVVGQCLGDRSACGM
jgi:sugar phosphate isomerase/epimerase